MSLNQWVGGIMRITVETGCDIQYLTISLSEYVNAPIEPEFLDLRHVIKYLMHHPHEPNIYSRNNIFKLIEKPHQCFYKEVSSDIKKYKNNTTYFTHTVI